MKIKFTLSVIVNVIIGIVISFTLATWVWLAFPSSTTFSATADHEGSFIVINNLPPLTQTISDSIPYYLHKRMQDSISQLRALRNGDGQNVGSSVYLGLWGTETNNYCDTCTIRYQKGASPSNFLIINKPVKTYLLLQGWKIKSSSPDLDSVKFHVEHDQAYLRKQLIDSIHTDNNGLIQKIARTRDIPVYFGYSRQFNCIKIPVTAPTKALFNYIFGGIALAGIVYFMFFVLGGFIKFLIDVSRGHTFTLKNIRRLKIIGISLIAIQAIPFLINLSMPLIFSAYFTSDVILNEKSWDGSWKWLLAGVACLLLYKAFRVGKKIKEEQDLVI